jgi:hypothetical protein
MALRSVDVTRDWKRAGAGVPGVAVLTVAAWWLWLGWDTQYQTDPVTGATSGPYEAWQVVGCVLSLAVIAVVGGLLMRPWLVVLAMTGAFTVSWSWAAASTDDSGLWPVGAVLVVIGLGFGSAVVSFGARAVRTVAHRTTVAHRKTAAHSSTEG